MEHVELDPNRIRPWHEPHDEAKLNTLIESMRTNGWTGAPVVTIAGRDFGWGAGDPQAITGSHRIAAARQAGIDVHAVDLDDLLRAIGTSLAEVDAYFGVRGDDERHYKAVVRLDQVLPRGIIDHYGLDAQLMFRRSFVEMMRRLLAAARQRKGWQPTAGAPAA